jgi:uncharacterized 2Fe-2S/4Fe-4S cluster protein (DUF4445 family)
MEEQKPITIHTAQNGREHFGEYGSCRNLLEYLLKKTPFRLPALCGGKGVCGKCRITVVSGSSSPPTTEERKLILPEALERGVRLACLTVPESDLSIRLEEEKELVGNKEDKFGISLPVDRSIHSVVVELPPPSLDDQRSDHTRLLSSPSLKGIEFPPALLQELPKVLREGNWAVTLQVLNHRVLSLHSESKLVDMYGVAVDIGTTTVAVYLFNLNTGEHLGTCSELNAQQVFGADVISRIQFAQEGLKNLRTLQEKILMQIDSMILHLAKINKLRYTTICLATIVGNPTMVHLALGLPPENIAQAPFIPVTTESLSLSPGELGLSLSPGGIVLIPPAVSAYVGSDILASVLASGMAEDADTTALLIDIGTNGEIVLSDEGRFTACSTAAGPAFEGAEISCGVGGIAGAINSVKPGKEIAFTTILNRAPLGVCGAGIVDLLALLLEAGLVDETGRMLTREEAIHKHLSFASQLTTVEGEPAFELVPARESDTGMPLLLTQQDVREIQLAKAAIAAGIRTLLNRMELPYAQIQAFYLAGGFGNYLNPSSAIRIGLMPRELEGKIRSIGNAAGKGAALSLVSEKAYSLFRSIKDRTKYIELSSSPDFQELYIDEMMFPG